MVVYERFYIKDVDWENFGVVDKVLNKLIAVTGSLMRCGRTWKFDFSIKICHKMYPYGKLVEQRSYNHVKN